MQLGLGHEFHSRGCTANLSLESIARTHRTCQRRVTHAPLNNAGPTVGPTLRVGGSSSTGDIPAVAETALPACTLPPDDAIAPGAPAPPPPAEAAMLAGATADDTVAPFEWTAPPFA